MATPAPQNKKASTAPVPGTSSPQPGAIKQAGIGKWGVFAVVVITAIVFSRATGNGFTNFDDDFYITNNPFLKDFSWHGLKAIFTSFYNGNYHPLTTCTYWLEYHFAGLDALPYHLLNILLHLANTWLVYKLVNGLSGKKNTALITALLFGIHPMHVESVAWVSERKDVLYTLFYLSSASVYLTYISGGYKKQLYFAALLLFALSLFSKPAAVTLPVLLIAIDWYKGRKPGLSSVVEKAPFFILAIVFGVVAIFSQKSGGALHDLAANHTFIERIFFFTYRLSSYLVNAMLPLHLSAMHHYPITNGGALPWAYYASLPFLLFITWLVSKPSSHRKDIIFGVAFFMVTISVMLQVIAVGGAITAERYTYVPYIGLFYISAQFCTDLLDGKYRNIIIGTLAVVIIAFSLLTWNRIAVWKDGYTLFTDVVEKEPGGYFGYWMRANLYNTDGKPEVAIEDYSNAIKYNPSFEDLYYDRGHAYFDIGNLDAAIANYKEAITLNPKMAEAYNDLGWTYYKKGDKDSAFLQINTVIRLNPQMAEAYNNRGAIYNETGNIDAAVPDFDKAILLKPNYELAYLNRAAIKANKKDFNAALGDYTAVININPQNNMAFYYRGMVKMNMGDKQSACNDWGSAQQLGNENAAAMINRFCKGN